MFDGKLSTIALQEVLPRACKGQGGNDRALLADLASAVKARNKLVLEGRASLRLMLKHVEDACCDDPEDTICNLVALPILRERIQQAAQDAAERESRQAELDILQSTVQSH